MKKLLISASLFIAILFVFSANSHAQALTFQITNNTGVLLNNLYVTPSETTNWGNDILPNDMFEAGSTVTVTIILPVPYPRTCGMPRALMRNSVLGCVPCGIFKVSSPSNVGTVISPPKAAVVKEMGSVMRKSFPSRVNILCGKT